MLALSFVSCENELDLIFYKYIFIQPYFVYRMANELLKGKFILSLSRPQFRRISGRVFTYSEVDG